MPNSSTSRFTRFLCSLACALAFCSSSPRTYADELEEVVSLTLDDLDPDTRSAVVGLATSISGVNATQATVDDNVASILALLTSMRLHTTSGLDYMRTVPYYNASANFYVPLGAYLRFGLGDWTGAPNQANSYLYQIQRALLGTSGVPSSSDAIQPILLRIEDKLNAITNGSPASAQSNVWTRADVEEALLHVYNIDSASWGLLDEYQLGSHTDAWDVWLEDAQLASLLSAVGSVSNAVYDLAGLFASGNVTVDLSPVTDRQDAWQDYADDVDDAEAYQYAVFQNTATSRDQEDADLIDDTVDEFEHTYSASPPSMDTYTTASTTEAQDVDKDSLLDALDGDVEHPSRWVLLTSSDAQGATGQSFEMAVSFNEGRLGTFISDASGIMSAGWYGLLAALSALLFWRKQTEISAIVHGTNFSRV